MFAVFLWDNTALSRSVHHSVSVLHWSIIMGVCNLEDSLCLSARFVCVLLSVLFTGSSGTDKVIWLTDYIILLNIWSVLPFNFEKWLNPWK